MLWPISEINAIIDIENRIKYNLLASFRFSKSPSICLFNKFQ